MAIIYDSSHLGEMPSQTLNFKVCGGFKAGEKVVRVIASIANQYKKNPLIRNLAVRLVSNLDSNDYLGEARTLFEFVRDNIRYVRDIRGVETLQTPDVTLPKLLSPNLGIGSGDCDDHVILLASLLLSIGAKDIYAKIVCYTKEAREFQHIYLVIKIKNKFYSMDAIVKNQSFGYEVKHIKSKMIQIG